MKPLTLREDLPLDAAMEDVVQRAHRRSWNIGFRAGIVVGHASATGEPLSPEMKQYIGELLGDED